MTTKEIALSLATVTEEQWEAILAIKHITRLPVTQELSSSNNQEKAGVNNETELRLKVADLIKRMGVPPHILGYNYVQEAVILVYEDEEYMHNIIKKLYPEIAKKYGTTGSRVERAIRNAFKSAYTKGNPKVLEDVFKTKEHRLVNSYAIASIVEYIKMYNWFYATCIWIFSDAGFFFIV